MKRRVFLTAIALIPFAGTVWAATDKKYVFRIKTKSKQITGNIVIYAPNAERAKYILMQRYPGCEIMDMEEK